MNATYNYDDLPWNEVGKGWRTALLGLKEGESAWDPASTKRLIYGPALVTYEEAPSGGIRAIVRPV